MKTVLRKDRIEILPSFAMMVMAFVILECLFLAGLGMKNYNLSATCVTMAAIALIITIVWHLYLPGAIFLKNINNRAAYFDELAKRGMSMTRIVLLKMAYSFASLVAFVLAYIGALYFDMWPFLRLCPEEQEKLKDFGFRKMIAGDNEPFGRALASTVFEYLSGGILLLILSFFVVAFVYAMFVRKRFVGFTAVVLYIVLFGSYLKLYQQLVAGRGSVTGAHVAAGIAQTILAALLLTVTLLLIRKKLQGGIQNNG